MFIMAQAESEGPQGKAKASWATISKVIRDSDKRALTGNEIASESGLTPKTVYKHIESVWEANDDIRREEIGGSMAYWAEPNDESDSTFGLVGIGSFTGASSAVAEGVRSKISAVTAGKAITTANLSVSLAGAVALVYWVGLTWGIPMLGWAVGTYLIYRPDWRAIRHREAGSTEREWLFLQPVGLLTVLSGSYIMKPLGVGPGIGGAPNVWIGVDVTRWLIFGLAIFIAASLLLELRHRSNPNVQEVAT